MKILIVAEGEHELGKEGAKGALRTLVERLRGVGVECEKWTVRHPELVRVHGKGAGMLKKAVSSLRQAEKRGFDAIVFVVDEDGDRSRRKQVEEAQEYLTFPIRRAMGVAIRTFDAWMLADEVALTKAMGAGVGTQPSPEEIVDGKEHCRRLCAERGCEMELADVYEEVAREARLEVMETRCADGFGVFARRVRAM